MCHHAAVARQRSKARRGPGPSGPPRTPAAPAAPPDVPAQHGWQDAASPWTEPRPVLPTWATVGRWILLGAFCVGLMLGGPAILGAFAFMAAAIGIEALAARSAPKAPYPRVRRPVLVVGTVLTAALFFVGVRERAVLLVLLGVVVCIAYRLYMTRATRAAFPDAVAAGPAAP